MELFLPALSVLPRLLIHPRLVSCWRQIRRDDPATETECRIGFGDGRGIEVGHEIRGVDPIVIHHRDPLARKSALPSMKLESQMTMAIPAGIAI